ncbi:MAG TPA: BF3164 family lipoprotein [Longimicrobium sp.]|uniref:BF3164 family lipoprotein n=1 Tax=Longimicrobium sp. TaxID=2029185 RepID=UPI002ED7C29C
MSRISGPAPARRIGGRAGLALVALTVAAGVGGCGNAAPPPPPLRGHLLTDTVSLAFPTGLALTAEGHVVVVDLRAPEAVRVFDSAGALVAKLGKEGSGPGEFVNALSVFGRPGHPGELWIHDTRLDRIVPVQGQAFRGAAPGAGAFGPAVTLKPGIVVESPRWLDDTTLVALNPMLSSGEQRFVRFGADGVRRATVGGPAPQGAGGGGSSFVRQQAWGGEMAVHPSRPVFVLASRYAGRLEAFDRDGALRVKFRVPHPFDPDYAPGDDGINMVRGEDFRFGYLDVAATEQHVYALFSGRLHREHGAEAEAADQVHVFDWKGDLLQVIRLDTPIGRLAVDTARRTLYGIRHDPYPQVVAFPLPAS